jgi:shikimate kinase
MNIIFLIGFMGAGKSATGMAVADLCGFSFVDLDRHIESIRGQSIPDIFQNVGETGFREIERMVLTGLIRAVRSSPVSEGSLVVACGGGTPCFFDNMEVMNGAGTTVYLSHEAEKLADRIAENRGVRPLVPDEGESEGLSAFVQSLLNKREPYYRKAKHTIPVGDEEVEVLAEKIISLLET